MAKYYVFEDKDTFITVTRKHEAMHWMKQGRIVFQHIQGIPNPWYCYLLKENGRPVISRKDKPKVFKPSQIKPRIEKMLKQRAEKAPKKYIPDHIVPYLDLLNNTGGNKPEDLLRRLDTEEHLMQTNVVVAVLASMCEAQVGLLRRLHEEGLLLPRKEKVDAKDS